jgi:hypothetical protein
LEKKYSVKNSLFVDFILFFAEKGKNIAKIFAKHHHDYVVNMKGCLKIFLLSYLEAYQIWLSILMEMANREKKNTALVLSPLQGESIKSNLYMLATNSKYLGQVNWPKY